VADPNGPYTGRLGTPVSFDGRGSSDPDGTIARYDWDFGDGNTAMDGGSTPSHIYEETPWQYIVTLKVTDDSGEFVSATTTATIGIGNLPPVAEAGSAAVGSDSMTRNFDGSQSVDPNVGGSIVDWSWDFGDGTSGSGETTSHTYTSFGNFNVTLTVTDNEGKTDSDNTLAVIEPPPPCDCDLNSDGSCDESDWLLFFPDWERTDCNETDVEPCECDLNDDGSCDFSDLVLFFSDWGRDDCPAPVD
jgi:chitodextrinase